MAVSLAPAPSRLVPSSQGAPETPDALIPLREVSRRAGVGRSTIERLERKGNFPKRIRIGRATRWSAHAIQRWIDEQIARAGRA